MKMELVPTEMLLKKNLNSCKKSPIGPVKSQNKKIARHKTRLDLA